VQFLALDSAEQWKAQKRLMRLQPIWAERKCPDAFLIRPQVEKTFLLMQKAKSAPAGRDQKGFQVARGVNFR
jgi:hypothetical protein